MSKQAFKKNHKNQNLNLRISAKIWIILLLMNILFINTTNSQEIKAVDNFDLKKYMGKWYEIASYPQIFQKGCHCTTAEYTLSEKGYVIVENRCKKGSINGPESYIKGKAFLEKLDLELAEMIPAKFGKKTAFNPMEGSTNGTARPSVSSGKKSYNNLPSDAKSACDKFVKQGLMTKEQYVAEYSWD